MLNVGVRVGVAEGCGIGVLVAGGRGVVGTGEYCGSVGVRVGVARGVGVSVGLISTVDVGVRVRVGVKSGVGVRVGVRVLVAVACRVAVAVTRAVLVGVRVIVGVRVMVGVNVMVGVRVATISYSPKTVQVPQFGNVKVRLPLKYPGGSTEGQLLKSDSQVCWVRPGC